MVKVRQRSEVRREQIAAAALKVLSEQGVHRLTVAAIGAEVGLADGSVFRHFASKEEILAAAIDHFERLLFEDFPPRADDPIERLRLFVAARLRLVRARPAILRLAFNDRLAEAAGPELALRVQAAVARSQMFVRTCLIEAQHRGLAPRRIPVEVLVWMVVGVLHGLGRSYLSGAALLTEEEAWVGIERTLALAAGADRGA